MKKTSINYGKMTAKKKNAIQCFMLVLPFIIFVFAFSYIPLFGWSIAFSDFKMGQSFQQINFVGLKHFVKLINDDNMFRVLRNTLVMSALKILVSPLPMCVAILLNDVRNRTLKKLFQTTTTLPHFISWIVVFGVAYSMFSTQGLVNQVLKMLNLPTSPFGLLGDLEHTWLFQLFLNVWKSLGWDTIIYMAAITGIDTELFDASKVDGANKIQTIRYITLPGLLPTFLVLFLLNVSNILNSGFEQYYVFWNTLVSDKIEVLDYYVYNLAFRTNQYPYSIAVGMMKSVVSIILLFVVNFVSKKVRGTSIV